MKPEFKRRLKDRELLAGPLLTLGAPEAAEMMAEIGFDFLWIEMEHAPIDLLTAQRVAQAAGPCATLIRAPWNDAVWIKRILDTGCDGVVIPQIRSGEDARLAVLACRYPPEGVRSVGIARAQKYGMGLQAYIERANEDLVVALQVEHTDGVNAIDAILSVAGIDAIIIGPYDLSASLGLIGQVGHPDVEAAISKVTAACLAQGVPAGVFAGDAKSARPHIERGCTLIALGADTKSG